MAPWPPTPLTRIDIWELDTVRNDGDGYQLSISSQSTPAIKGPGFVATMPNGIAEIRWIPYCEELC
jgi:hypothetical protein